MTAAAPPVPLRVSVNSSDALAAIGPTEQASNKRGGGSPDFTAGRGSAPTSWAAARSARRVPPSSPNILPCARSGFSIWDWVSGRCRGSSPHPATPSLGCMDFCTPAWRIGAIRRRSRPIGNVYSRGCKLKHVDPTGAGSDLYVLSLACSRRRRGRGSSCDRVTSCGWEPPSAPSCDGEASPRRPRSTGRDCSSGRRESGRHSTATVKAKAGHACDGVSQRATACTSAGSWKSAAPAIARVVPRANSRRITSSPASSIESLSSGWRARWPGWHIRRAPPNGAAGPVSDRPMGARDHRSPGRLTVRRLIPARHGPMELSLQVSGPGDVILIVGGRLDLEAADPLAGLIETLIGCGAHGLLLDLTTANTIVPAAAYAWPLLARWLAYLGGSIAVIIPADWDYLDQLRLIFDDALPVFTSRARALRYLDAACPLPDRLPRWLRAN